MTATCGLDACASPCHDPAITVGRYCAPARCYCGGCPGSTPLPPSPGPMTVEQMEARREQAVTVARQAVRQPTLADARRERDEAMGRVASSTSSEWEAAVSRAIVAVADTGVEFSTDDVWAALEHAGVPKPREPRALGPIMRRFVTIGSIEPVGFTPSVRRHATPIRTYRKATRR